MRRLLLFCFCLILLVSCKMDVNLSDEIQVDWADSECWMKDISDKTLLKDLNIPGTHDTCANYDFLGLSSTAAAQDLTLIQQLNAGVRYIDIRPCLENGEMIIRHGPTKQHISFTEVLTTVSLFLEKNRSETVIMAIYPEYSDVGNLTNSYNFLKSQDLSNCICSVDASKLELGECRGKIVLVSRLTVPSEMSDVFCSKYTETGAMYKTTDLSGQWNIIKSSLDSHSRNVLIAVYTAGYYEGQFGIPNIRIASSFINAKLKEYLDEQTEWLHCGIVVTDHITKNLAHSIYKLNK